MPEQLKIVIDADVDSGINKINKFGNVVTGQFSKITGAASGMEASIASSIQKINSSLSSLKVSSLDVNVNTSQVDAAVQNIRSKFSTLVDPELNILANSTQAETVIKDLIAELTALKDSEVFIRANDSQALKVISEVETELNSLLDKQIKLNIDSADATTKLNLLEKELADLQALVISPNISTNQLRLFQANIERLKAEIASLKGQGVVIPIGIDTAGSQAKLNSLSETIETLRGKIEAKKFSITVETDITKIAAYNKEIERLEARMRQIQNVGKKGFELFIVPGQTIRSVKNLSESVAAFGGGVRTFIPPAIQGFTKLGASVNPVIGSLKNLEKQAATSGAALSSSFGKAFGGLKSLAALIPGIGLGGLIGLAATAVNELTEGLFDAAFGATKLDQAIDAAASSFDKNAASVITMVKALQSGTLTSSEFKKVKAELIAQAPEFQNSFNGDKISIEASDTALKKYISQLTTTIKVTAALGVVNDTLAESIKTIAKGGTLTFGQKLKGALIGFFDPVAGGVEIGTKAVESIDKAIENLKPENVSKLLEDTFKKLGISFTDFAETVDPDALKKQLDKIKADFEKFQNETIARAKLASKEFGKSFIVPDLEETFFKNKQAVFKEATKFLSDVKLFLSGNIGALKLKIPVQTEFAQVKEDITKNIQDLNKVIATLRGNEIAISIKQEGDVKQIAEQLTKLKGVQIPIVIEQKGNVEKIAKELSSLKGTDLKIKISKDGNIKDIVNDLKGIKDVDVKVSTNASEALSEIDKLIKGKEFPIVIDQDGIIFQISKAIDGAISVTQTKKVLVPIITEFDFLPIPKDGVGQEVIDNFFKGIAAEREIPVKIIPDFTIDKSSIDAINQKLDLRKQFSILGDLGLKEFNKLFKDIDTNNFSNLTQGIQDATVKLQGMLAIATTLQQSIGQGLTNAFNSMFDAALQGKSVFKALAEGIKQLIVGTIKAVAQMLILRAVTSFIFPGAGGIPLPGTAGPALGGVANFGQLSGIGSRAFQNVLTINVNGQISGDTIRLAGQRAANSQGRFG